MFDQNSLDGVTDLLRVIGSDLISQSVRHFLKSLAEKLEKEEAFDDIATNIFSKCFDYLQLCVPPRIRSITDDFQTHLNTLLTICSADKRYAKAVAACPFFVVDESLRPPQGSLFNFNVEGSGIAGAALEHRTLLGRVLRIAVDVRDPAIFELFKDAHKSSKNIVDSKMNNLRGLLNLVQSQGHELVLSLLKGGALPKESVMLWLQQSVALNIEATKDTPSPIACSTPGMLSNLAAVQLRLCRPGAD